MMFGCVVFQVDAEEDEPAANGRAAQEDVQHLLPRDGAMHERD
jgi:hypothetical protein